MLHRLINLIAEKEILKRLYIACKPRTVFNRLADHEDMANWPGITGSILVKEGSPRNGMGAIRKINVAGLTLLEEIVEFEPPRRMAYTIIKGLPVKHRGTITLKEDTNGTLLEWQIRLTSHWPFLGPIMRVALDIGLERALHWVKNQLESHHEKPI